MKLRIGLGLGQRRRRGGSGAGGGGGDTTDPVLAGAPVTAANGGYIDVTINEPCNTDNPPAAGSFTLANTPATVASTAFQSSTVLRLTLAGFIIASETPLLSYTQGVNPVQDVAGNLLDNFAAQAVTNVSTARLAGVIRTLLASATQAGLAEKRAVTLIAWGAGSGGYGDNNTGQSAAGAGGACALEEIASGEASYSFVAGVGGTLGLLGTSVATNGTASSWSGSGGVVCQANGGTAGTAHVTTPVASVGGTGGVGDTINSGGAGTTGSTACTGGGSGGTTGAASGTIGGTPNGVTGNQAGFEASPSSGGSVSTAGIAAAGGHGWGRIFASKAADLAFPFVSPEVSLLSETVNGVTRNLTRAGTHETNDRLITFGAIDGADGSNAMSGWTKMCDQADATDLATLSIMAIDSTGSESLTWTSLSEMGQFFMFRVKNAAPVADWSITSTTKAIGANTNLPSHTHPAGSKPILWLSAIAFDGRGAVDKGFASSLFPAGWDGLLTIWLSPNGSTGDAPGLVIVGKVSASASEDPPAMVHSYPMVGGMATLAIPLLGS